ncbi:hypothetical protein IQ266_02095 [filamentous cyanobacterium LEGE 11480]|uniref:Uncharacterized protein n=1 Tax=Romeriopsis navalis LEGE 11480 TaxID=2777977 RepID=A0A928Z207_9CYAN|nr:hypothetical protein [Romeriopsis navalis]MBE9028547.1 hypothetical protein [Romeriopsis navalis LEGE 11480]
MSEKPEQTNSPETPEPTPESPVAEPTTIPDVSPAASKRPAETVQVDPSPVAAASSSAAASSLNQVIEKVQPIVQKAWVTTRPTLTQALKATIGTLETTVDKLETQMQSDGSEAKPLNVEPVKQAANTFWGKTQPIWTKLIGLIRSRLPDDVSGKLTDRALSGVIAGLALLLLSITTHLPSGSAAPKPTPKPVSRVPVQTTPVRQSPVGSDSISKQFPVDAAKSSNQPFPDRLSAPGTTPAPTTPQVPAPRTTSPQAVPAPTPTAATAPKIAPVTPPTSTTTSKPAPAVKLTPEQKLMAKLQAAATDQSELITAVKSNKTAGTLKVTFNPDWYDLQSSQQDTLAQNLFDKAQNLRFNSLELLDPQGEIVARSPIVGSDMVVLLRESD